MTADRETLTAREAEEMRLVTTRAVDDAPLPANYEAAKRELAECARVDEAATWASKAAALASYARQSKDESLEKAAMRIRARAIRRCGELLKEIPARPGYQKNGGGAPPPRSERAQAAKEAGLSREQAKDAVRLAKIPQRSFEEAVESDDPPTVTELAERGTQKKPLVDLQGRDPEDFNRSLLVNGALYDLAETVAAITPRALLRGCLPRQLPRIRESASALSEWLSTLLPLLEGGNEAKRSDA